MSRGSKVLTLFLLECALLGGAFGGGYYKQRQITDECNASRAVKDQAHRTMQAWQQVMAAAVGAMAGNYAYAVLRTADASAAAAAAGLKLEKDFAEINNLLVTQNPLSRERLLALADKVMPGALGQPGVKLLSSGGGAAAPAASSGTGAVPGPGDGLAVAATVTPPPVAGAAEAKATQQAPAAAAPGASPAAATGRQDPPSSAADLGNGHRALLEAKASLLAGGDQAATLHQIALAQALLDDAGQTGFDDVLGAAMKAVREKDEAHARSAIEAALAKLRAP